MTDRDSEQEIREIFAAWWRAAAAKDIDATMQPVAHDVHSYEHEAPLQYRGADAMRAVCQGGFDAMPGELCWDIPDLQVVVRGDIAITWGLNRMRARAPGKPAAEFWSRGTRVLQKIGGQWKLIHQHVSFPYDPQTGAARTDLKP